MCQSKISVIVPVYNTEDYLPRCIESILGQTYQNIEIVLVDDGSTDSSLCICEKYAGRDSRVVVIKQENKGNNAARKAGLKACTGEYITFVDSDDWIGSNLVALLYEQAIENYADMVVSNVMMIRVEGTEEERRNLIDAGVYERPRDAVKKLFFKSSKPGNEDCKYGILPFIFAKLYRKDLLVQSMGRIEDRMQFDEDRALVWTCLMQDITVVFVDAMEYYYCQRQEGLVRSVDEMYLAKINYFYCYMKGLFAQEDSILMEQLEQYVLWNVRIAFRWKMGFSQSYVLQERIKGGQNRNQGK